MLVATESGPTVSAWDDLSGALPLGALEDLNENTRLGFRRENTTLHLDRTCSKTDTALGIQQILRPESIRSRYTGKERDSESGLDNFGARYDSSQYGRFMSPDWNATVEPVPYAKLDNPQSLNLYSYVLDNPMSLVDVDGHDDDVPFYAKNIAGLGPADLMNLGLNPFTGKDPSLPDTLQDNQPSSSSSSKGSGRWSRLKHHLSNLFHGLSWNYGMGEVVTHIFPREPNPTVSGVTDAAGLAAAIAGKAGNKLGIATSILSLANDRSPKNVIMNAAPFVFPDTGVPLAIYGIADDGADFAAKQVIIPVFTPDASQSQTIDGVPNPAMRDECQALGGC